MSKLFNVFLLNLTLFLAACNGIDCDQLPNKYINYHEAVNKIKTTKFKIIESVNTSKSSWIRGGEFYSCDGITGFFILKTDKQLYLYSEMPFKVWQGFKNSESFGSYYNYNIKHKYPFYLN